MSPVICIVHVHNLCDQVVPPDIVNLNFKERVTGLVVCDFAARYRCFIFAIIFVFRSALSLEFLIVCLNLDHQLLSSLKNVQRQVVIQRLLLHEEDVLQHVPISLISYDIFAFR